MLNHGFSLNLSLIFGQESSSFLKKLLDLLPINGLDVWIGQLAKKS